MFVTSPTAANLVPKLSPVALFKRADIVAIVRVTSVFTRQLAGGVEKFGCWNATTLRSRKGAIEPDIVMCLGGIAENNPPAPRVGQTYEVYLQRSPSGAWFPTTRDSWALVER